MHGETVKLLYLSVYDDDDYDNNNNNNNNNVQ